MDNTIARTQAVTRLLTQVLADVVQHDGDHLDVPQAITDIALSDYAYSSVEIAALMAHPQAGLLAEDDYIDTHRLVLAELATQAWMAMSGQLDYLT